MIFHSIYVQPINKIIAIMFIALIVWTIVGLCIQRHKNALLLWRVINSALAVVSAIGILYFTIVDRTSSGAHSMPFIRTIEHIQAQPELIREMIMNAFLFFPLGLTMPYALESVVKKNGKIALITVLSALVLSGCIEPIQHLFNFGNAELSDIVMNTAGATIGSLSYIMGMGRRGKKMGKKSFWIFVRRHICLLLILFLIPAVIGGVLLFLDLHSSISIETSDWITLIGGLLTYYGTVILAFVTVLQNDKLIEFQTRQEERDKLQQGIAEKQLEIAERQKEIADRQLHYAERDQEINETSLRNSNQPNIEITLEDENEEVVELERWEYLDGYDHEFKACVNKNNESSTLYVVFENKSEIDAYDISLVGVEPKLWFIDDKLDFEEFTERRNEYYSNLSISTFKRIPSGDGRKMTFLLSKEEKSFAIHFTVSFRNAYNHWFYQDVVICLGKENDRIEVQLQINDSKQGKKDVNERGVILYEDGKSLTFPPEKGV